MSGSEHHDGVTAAHEPTQAQIRRWQRYLADEIAEGQIYRDLAQRSKRPERDILIGLADAEERHAQHWRDLLGEHAQVRRRPSLHRALLRFLARIFGSVFVLALMQRAESNTPYTADSEVPREIAADEAIHEEVVRGLAARGRETMAGNFRAAVFGANDGLVSNLALVIGVAAAGIANTTVLLTGISGLLAGALSMGAGEWVSVRSQRELLDASTPDEKSNELLPALDYDANELALVYRARGMEADEADKLAARAFDKMKARESVNALGTQNMEFEEIGSPWRAAISSFLFFSTGAIIPVVPFLFTSGMTAILIATILVGGALLFTGGVVGILSGKPPVPRAFRQLLIGYGAGIITFALGLLFGTTA